MRSCRRLRLACWFVLLAGAGVAAGCATEKSANPLSPSVAGPIPGVGISAPSVVTPSVGSKIKDTDQPITLTIGNSTTNGVRPLSYHFQLASDSGFKHKLFDRAGISPGSGGHTSVKLSDSLASGDTYYWRARAEDGANSSNYSGTFSFSVYTPVVLGAPGPISPINGEAVASTSATLTFSNASHSGPAGHISYTVEYSTSSGFGGAKTVHKSEQSGQTSVSVSGLNAADTYYWRVRATDPGSDTTGPWSSTASFKTPAASSGGGTSGGGTSTSGTCDSNSPEAIVSCERDKFGHMSDSDLGTFLINVAKSLNRNGISGGPFGALKKSGGHNCGGYSCDVVCAGSGTAQKQWDVLSDSEGAQNPTWNGPSTYPNIRVDVCVVP